MPNDELTIVQTCGACGSEVGTFTVKKDNMMLVSKESIWCPVCQADRPEVRDLAGRNASVQKEQETYADNKPADQTARREGRR
jgi:hypothetical protein